MTVPFPLSRTAHGLKHTSGAEIGVCVGRARISATELYLFWRPIRSQIEEFKLQPRAMAGDLVTRWSSSHQNPRGGRLADVLQGAAVWYWSDRYLDK